jgi:hypothetical protein
MGEWNFKNDKRYSKGPPLHAVLNFRAAEEIP